jgi:hypothetical protein
MKNFWKILVGLVVVGVIFFALAIVLFFKTLEKQEMQVFFPQSQAIFKVEIASSPIKRTRGLMWRQNLPVDHGMLFVSSSAEIQSFWMKNTLIPLDIIFIDADGKIVDIKRNFLPCKNDPCESYSSVRPAKYVLEINAGQAEKIKIGDTMNIK